MNFIGKLLPVDGYRVLFSGSLSIDFTQSLTHLYQPLIGSEAIVLYQTLLHEIDLMDGEGLQTHHSLMNYLNLPLDDIYEVRLKLEGLGLLKTYENKTEDQTFYIYELHPPFAPQAFFQDAMLTELLYHHIGETKFQILQQHYKNQSQTISGQDITASFSDVFQTFQPSGTSVEIEAKPVEPTIPTRNIEFTWIEQTLKKQMIPVQRVLTESNKKVIEQIMNLYDLETYEIEKSLLWALTDENTLDIDEFKVACHDLFKVKHNQAPLRLSKQKQTEQHFKKPVTKEDKLVQTLETISPKQLLEDLSGGNHASEQDLKIIREVMVKQGLTAPVMNVLTHYVLLQSNMQLSKAYLDKIASHWSRADLTTAAEAMAFAKGQLEDFKNKRQSNRKTATNEVIPDWFKERKQQPADQKVPKSDHKKQEEEKAEILALLQKHASKKG